jgi:two-component system, LytTR family, sensor histidine kinase LytS
MTVIHLFIDLAENFGLIVGAAFLLLSWSAFQKILFKQSDEAEKLLLILFFGIFGVIGTYAGVPIHNAIANLRAIGVIAGGLFGGPMVGMGAGLIAGGHRFLIDVNGFTSLPCGLSTFLEGVAAGLISIRLKDNILNPKAAVLIGVIGESAHMLITLALARPYDEAWVLVKIVAIPMITLNAVGAGLFVQIIRFVLTDREKIRSIQAQKALNIANRTVSHLRFGLTPESAAATARIIYDNISVAAVSLTNNTHILAFIGAGNDHHQAGQEIMTKSTCEVLETDTPVFLKSGNKIGCMVTGCPLKSAIIIPLRKGGEVIGTLKLYGDKAMHLNTIDFQIALGLADLFSTQLELEDVQLNAQLLAQAEIRRLQSQINPHFLFNSLNTIGSFCRTNSNKARELIHELANYLRKNLGDNRNFIKVTEELEQVKSYLSIEQARFGNRIQVFMKIEPGTEEWPIPPLTIQPLVENAVKHGLAGQEDGGHVRIEVSRSDGSLHVRVQDDGVGMGPEHIEKILSKNGLEDSTGGIGLNNINQRLERIYGPKYRLKIDSRSGKGTSVHLKVPDKSAVKQFQHKEENPTG